MLNKEKLNEEVKNIQKNIQEIMNKEVFNEKKFKQTMNEFHRQLEKRPEDEREYLYIELMPFLRTIAKETQENMDTLKDLQANGQALHNANTHYGKY